MRRDPRLPESLRASSPLLALALLAATPAAARAAAAPPQEAQAAARAGVLKALIVLKIAPYLTPEPKPGEPKHPEPPKDKVRGKESKDGKDDREEKDDKESRERRPDDKGDRKHGKHGADAPREREYRIGLVGTDEVCRAVVQLLPGKCVGEAKVDVVVVKAEHAADPEVAAEYELLYVANSVDDEVCRRIVAASEARATPVVSARVGFAALGGGVQLFVQDNAVKFELNAEALRKQGLRVDSQLLKLSKKGPQ